MLFKASSRTDGGALLLLANLADAEVVEGEYRLADITDLPDGDYAVWSQSQGLVRPGRGQAFPVRLKRFAHDLVHVALVIDGTAVLGLKEKRNGLASVRDILSDGTTFSLTARDEGTLLLWRDKAPALVTIDGAAASFAFSGNQLEIALTDGPRAYKIRIS